VFKSKHGLRFHPKLVFTNMKGDSQTPSSITKPLFPDLSQSADNLIKNKQPPSSKELRWDGMKWK
jgi:hypothetical protein